MDGTDKHAYRLGRQYSLGRNKYFQQVYRKGKSYPSRYMVLVYLRATNLKVGFSASSKVGNAVTRNRLRRLMREDFRMLRGDLKPGKYIFVARTASKEAPHAAITEDMRKLLEKAGSFSV